MEKTKNKDEVKTELIASLIEDKDIDNKNLKKCKRT